MEDSHREGASCAPTVSTRLAAPHEGTLPKPGLPISEKNERPIVRRYRMIGIEASDYLHESQSLNRYLTTPVLNSARLR